MGWNIYDDCKCPKCGSKKTLSMDRYTESFLLMCSECGLHLSCNYKEWVVSRSYIDESIIGKDPQTFDPDRTIDYHRNDGVIKEGTII